MAQQFAQSVRKPLIRREIMELRDGESSILVTKRGTPLPLFFVSADSKQLKFAVSRLECALVGDFVSADSKGLVEAKNLGTRLLAGKLTEEAGSGAVSREQTAATIRNIE